MVTDGFKERMRRRNVFLRLRLRQEPVPEPCLAYGDLVRVRELRCMFQSLGLANQPLVYRFSQGEARDPTGIAPPGFNSPFLKARRSPLGIREPPFGRIGGSLATPTMGLAFLV